MNKARIALIPVAGIASAWLLYVAVSSFVSIQGVAEITADARRNAILSHVVVPLLGVSVIAGVFGVAWLVFGSESFRGGQGALPPNGIIKPSPPPPAPPKRDYPRPVETFATVITLREPNIDLSITLTGDAASDAVGRKKIGAVMEHYGSGASGKNAVAPVDGSKPTEGGAA